MRSLGPWASATMARTAARTSFTVAGPSRHPPRVALARFGVHSGDMVR